MQQRSLIRSVSCPDHNPMVPDRCKLCLTAKDINDRLRYEQWLAEPADEL